MRAFLSYSRQDADFAGLFRNLLALAAPEVGLWMDERLYAGARYPEEILREVDTCDVFVAAISPAWLASTWCRREAERASTRRQGVQIVPLLLEDVSLDGTSLASFQAVDLRRWRIDGDRVLRAKLFDRFRPEVLPPPPPTHLHEALRGLVLWGANSATPDLIGRHLADLATWHAAQSAGDPIARARLLDALAGLHMTRRAWGDMIGATQGALDLLRSAGWDLPTEGKPFGGRDRTDDELGLLGEIYNRLALGARQTRDPSGAIHLRQALAVFAAIRQPLLRNEKTAQVHRELGTWAQEERDQAAARAHFQKSGQLLQGLPSQRFHIFQAAIKEAQVDLAEGRVGDARARLNTVAPHFSPDAPMDAPLAHQVLPHFLLTDAACAALTGDDQRARAALDRYVQLRAHRGGQRNRARQAAIRGLLVLPVALRAAAVAAALRVR